MIIGHDGGNDGVGGQLSVARLTPVGTYWHVCGRVCVDDHRHVGGYYFSTAVCGGVR